jgi:hypothetical protein
MGQTDSVRVCTVAAKYRRVHLIRYKRRERLNGQILELNPSVTKAQCIGSWAITASGRLEKLTLFSMALEAVLLLAK